MITYTKPINKNMQATEYVPRFNLLLQITVINNIYGINEQETKKSEISKAPKVRFGKSIQKNT